MASGKLVGDNTDVPGFIADLERFARQVRSRRRYTTSLSKSALVLGAGGSARAVVHALFTNDWRVRVAARRLEQAQELILSITRLTVFEGQKHITREPLSFIRLEPTSIRDQIGDISLIVNTTPLGMTPQVHTSAWPSGIPFPPGAIVYDLVYNPKETALARAARAAGLPARTGLGMLIEQATLAFERWTGLAAPRQAMWEAVNE
jgi:shikimate dehydrogenase